MMGMCFTNRASAYPAAGQHLAQGLRGANDRAPTLHVQASSAALAALLAGLKLGAAAAPELALRVLTADQLGGGGQLADRGGDGAGVQLGPERAAELAGAS
jgi:hypothetical protein